jgi:hypothetical protein
MRFFPLLMVLAVSLLVLSCGDGGNSSSKNDQEQETMTLTGGWDGCIVGFYPENGNEKLPGGDLSEVDAFEQAIGHDVGSVVWFPTWEDTFPAKTCEILHARGIVPHLTWEIFWPSEDPNNSRATDSTGYEGFNEVLAGEHDDYIDEWAQGAKAFGQPLLMRFLHEFNGNWYVWSGNKNGRENGGPKRVVEVWRYVVDRFRAQGADNVLWLWVPHGPSTDRSEEDWNDVANYWPGDEYVDWIGLDGYNFYPVDPWGGKRPLRTFDDCFRELYDDCAVLGDQPMMLAEFGTGEFEKDGFDKAAWVAEAFEKLPEEYPRVKIYTWFNINKELDWRVNSSPEALAAFQTAMESPFYLGSPYQE